MPYYEKINMLFLHVPKTGGTSVETYLKTLSPQTLYTSRINKVLPESQHNNKSMQHQTYLTIYKYRELLKVPFDASMQIITIVRNPYNRIMSDLFYSNLVKRTDSKEAICTAIKWFLQCDEYDNHNLPQHKLLTDDLGNLIPNLTIFHTERLTKDMHEFGYTEYKGKEPSADYFDFLNAESIRLINQAYQRDFDLFGYAFRK